MSQGGPRNIVLSFKSLRKRQQRKSTSVLLKGRRRLAPPAAQKTDSLDLTSWEMKMQ